LSLSTCPSFSTISDTVTFPRASCAFFHNVVILQQCRCRLSKLPADLAISSSRVEFVPTEFLWADGSLFNMCSERPGNSHCLDILLRTAVVGSGAWTLARGRIGRLDGWMSVAPVERGGRPSLVRVLHSASDFRISSSLYSPSATARSLPWPTTNPIPAHPPSLKR
jgi:hypothetical protein